MKTPLLTPPVKRWECALCGLEARTQVAGVHVEYHPCRALSGVAIPMTEQRSQPTRIVLVERQEYVGDERGVTFIDGKAISAVRTERADGSNDVLVKAPYAYFDSKAQDPE